jgi:NTE family protein
MVAFVVLGAGFAVRCARHPEPVLDLQLFSSRTFSVANAAMVLYAIGFFGMLLGNILFLRGVWHYTVLDAGLAVTPGPLVVAMVSSSAGRLASRIGFRVVLLCGSGVLTGGLLLYALRVGVRPDYVGVWLPSTLLIGLGIGLSFPVLGATAVSSLAPERFSVGSAVNQTARQVGGSVGVALLVVILGSSGAVPPLRSFQHLGEFAAAMSILSGVICLLLPGRRAVGTPAQLDAPAVTATR